MHSGSAPATGVQRTLLDRYGLFCCSAMICIIIHRSGQYLYDTYSNNMMSRLESKQFTQVLTEKNEK